MALPLEIASFVQSVVCNNQNGTIGHSTIIGRELYTFWIHYNYVHVQYLKLPATEKETNLFWSITNLLIN